MTYTSLSDRDKDTIALFTNYKQKSLKKPFFYQFYQYLAVTKRRIQPSLAGRMNQKSSGVNLYHLTGANPQVQTQTRCKPGANQFCVCCVYIVLYL